MNINELLERLEDVDVNISERTLRQWAYDGLITAPDPPPPKKPIPPRRPSFEELEKNTNRRRSGQGSKEWSEQSLEDAVAVWKVRQSPYGSEKGELVTNDTIKYIHHEAKNFHKLLITNCFVFAFNYLYTHISRESRGHKWKLKDVDNLIVSWIAAVEKLRHGIPLDIPVRVIFEWLAPAPYCKTIRMTYVQKGFQGVQLIPIARKDKPNKIELILCVSEGPKEKFRNYQPGEIDDYIVSEDGSVSKRRIVYFLENFRFKKPIFDLNRDSLYDPSVI